ncbi:protein of unknown function [Methanoculleus bourgensis]|uniref:Uncharacterized protein n=1 Tax=Methanoculleus bourgensis TaxID=83986 RepID=A0A0X3BIM9_9EURY|nr:protein of unknown function [Methanoculleus bourgensis]
MSEKKRDLAEEGSETGHAALFFLFLLLLFLLFFSGCGCGGCRGSGCGCSGGDRCDGGLADGLLDVHVLECGDERLDTGVLDGDAGGLQDSSHILISYVFACVVQEQCSVDILHNVFTSSLVVY